MALTLLQIVDQAAAEMGLAIPSTVIGNTQADVVQLLYLTNACGYELQRQYQWQALTTEYQFTTVFYSYTGTVTDGSTTLSALSSTTGLTTTPTYFTVTGTGIPQNTYLVSVNAGASTAVMTNAATATNTAVALTFTQTKYAMPTGFDRLVDRTDWDKSQHWEMLGPETAQQWQWLKSGFISTGPRIRYRVLGQLFQIWPAIGSDHVLGFEYVSNLWVAVTGAPTTPTKSAFTLDTDTCIFPDRLMVLMLKLKYFEVKGFETMALYRDFNMQLDLAKAHDGGSPTLSYAPRASSILVGFENIPDSAYGS